MRGCLGDQFFLPYSWEQYGKDKHRTQNITQNIIQIITPTGEPSDKRTPKPARIEEGSGSQDTAAQPVPTQQLLFIYLHA